MFRLSQKADYGLILLSSFATHYTPSTLQQAQGRPEPSRGTTALRATRAKKASAAAKAKADKSEDKSSRFIPLSKIAQKHKISAKFLSQIASDLKKAGILAAKEGVLGGYTLAREPGEIKLLDVLKVLDGDLLAGRCFEDDHECVCGAGEMWHEMRDQINNTLGNKTVADLVV